MILVGMIQGKSTVSIAKALRCNRAWLVTVRRKMNEAPWMPHLRAGGQVARHLTNGVGLEDFQSLIAAK
jgi:hypothetical protein